MFDATRYDREVLRPLRGTHGHLPAGDLLARYAVDPGMDAAQLAAHLAEIRAWWRERAQAPDFRAQVCRLLIDADQELAASAGAAMEDPAWWREQGRQSPAAGAAETPPPAGAQRAAPQRDWREDARSLFWSTLATLDRGPSVVVAERAETPAAPAADVEQPPPGPDLHVRAVSGDGGRCRVELSWPETTDDVHIRYSPDPPPYAAGAELPRQRALEWGEALPGRPVRRGGEWVLTASVPTGYLVYLPFTVTGEHARAGRLKGLSVAPPVQKLRVERDGHGAVATWIWPPGAEAAEVEWAGERRRFTLAEYQDGSGFAIADARPGGEVAVRAITPVGGALAHSPAARATIAPAPAHLAYDLTRRRRLAGPAELIVTVTADRDCSGVDLDLVLRTGEFMPLDSGEGDLLARFTGLELTVEAPLRLTRSWPDVARRDRPYWIRGFFRAPVPVSVEDPPIDHLRYA